MYVSKKSNPFILKAHAARTTSEDPLQKFKFRVTIPGLPSGIGFQKASGLSIEVGVSEYQESGYDYTHKLPGKVKVGEVTLERGQYADTSVADLIKASLTSQDMRQTIIIQQLDRFGNAQRTWKLAEAWVSKWEASDLDASSEDVAIEKITIQHEYFLD